MFSFSHREAVWVVSFVAFPLFSGERKTLKIESVWEMIFYFCSFKRH
jgi:hypothetical protein